MQVYRFVRINCLRAIKNSKMRVQKEGPCDLLDTSIGETWAIGGQAAHIFINESDSCTLDPLTITVLGRGEKWHNLLHTIIEEILNCETALRINIHQSVGVSYQWAVDKNNTKLQKEQVYDLLSTPPLRIPGPMGVQAACQVHRSVWVMCNSEDIHHPEDPLRCGSVHSIQE